MSCVDEFFPEVLLIFIDMRPSRENTLLFAGSSRSINFAIVGADPAGGIVLLGLAQAAMEIMSIKSKALAGSPVTLSLP
jgi:hypothetical protein